MNVSVCVDRGRSCSWYDCICTWTYSIFLVITVMWTKNKTQKKMQPFIRVRVSVCIVHTSMHSCKDHSMCSVGTFEKKSEEMRKRNKIETNCDIIGEIWRFSDSKIPTSGWLSLKCLLIAIHKLARIVHLDSQRSFLSVFFLLGPFETFRKWKFLARTMWIPFYWCPACSEHATLTFAKWVRLFALAFAICVPFR